MTFGGGEQQYIDAARRIISQAQSTNIFKETYGYIDVNLKEDQSFWDKHCDFIASHPRGYGYWIWKPYLILKTLMTLPENSILLYCDGGCEIDIKKAADLSSMLDHAKTDYIIGTTTQMERIWCKKDLIDYLEIKNNDYLRTPQRQATAIAFLKCDGVVTLVKLWYENACNYHLLDDSPSITKNLHRFREHRHDQSIFSLLTKKYNMYSNYSLSSVIELIRNRSGTTRI